MKWIAARGKSRGGGHGEKNKKADETTFSSPLVTRLLPLWLCLPPYFFDSFLFIIERFRFKNQFFKLFSSYDFIVFLSFYVLFIELRLTRYHRFNFTPTSTRKMLLVSLHLLFFSFLFIFISDYFRDEISLTDSSVPLPFFLPFFRRDSKFYSIRWFGLFIVLWNKIWNVSLEKKTLDKRRIRERKKKSERAR